MSAPDARDWYSFTPSSTVPTRSPMAESSVWSITETRTAPASRNSRLVIAASMLFRCSRLRAYTMM
ncbi:hypothetical protein NMG29_07680 [Streptomyces cocklensis]|nr:hypothetical protein [Actinacidiphila cocklensis]MDD1058108.1 hypothetical protein [Actinacidiphila cocklensis]